MSTKINRREFLKRTAQYAALGSAGPLAVSLSTLAQASAFTALDYKAVVCVYLYGGNDNSNTVVPYDTSSYNQYNNLRTSIALPRTSLSATVLQPMQALSGGLQFALESNLAPLMPFFNNNQMDVILNIGSLIQPTTRAQYLANSAALPPRLFSHNDQQKYTQSLTSAELAGWGGQIENLLQSANAQTTFGAISTAGNSLFLSGGAAVQYQLGSNGSVAINGISGTPFGSSSVASALKSIISTPVNQVFGDQITATVNNSISAHNTINAVFAGPSPFGTLFPSNNSLATQLQNVARVIQSSQTLGLKRQVFFVSLGGFDTHDHISTAHPPLMATLSNAISPFLNALIGMNKLQNVLTFTASDFGRTLTSNGDGSDHGWGSHHFAFGGPITTSKFIGVPPVLATNGPDDVGQGRYIPTTSYDQLAYSAGSWLGASAADLNTVLPNVKNFPVITL